MRESFTYGSVGRAPGNRCLYPEPDHRNNGKNNGVRSSFLTNSLVKDYKDLLSA